MKVKVIAPTIDTYTGEHYEIGQVLDLDEQRANQGICFGFFELVKKTKKVAKPKSSNDQ